MNFELVDSHYIDSTVLRMPDYRVGRINFGTGRSYIRILPDGSLEQPFVLYTSLTTAIDSCMPTATPLLQWYCNLGYEEAKRMSKVAQQYGTFLHLEIGLYLTMNAYNFDTIQERITAFLAKEKYWQPECAWWEDKIKHDMVAFIAFAQEYRIQPICIEVVLLSQRGFGTMIDLVCNMMMPVKGFHGEVYKSGDRKGQPKETTEAIPRRCVINFKSGRHGFYPSNGIQIQCEKLLWEENFPELPIDCALNWSPKEWETTPSWNLKDWTGDISQEEVDAVLSLAQIRYSTRAMNKKYISIAGQFVGAQLINECIKMQTVEEYAREKYNILATPVIGMDLAAGESETVVTEIIGL